MGATFGSPLCFCIVRRASPSDRHLGSKPRLTATDRTGGQEESDRLPECGPGEGSASGHSWGVDEEMRQSPAGAGAPAPITESSS
jgi:hypothetical protein